MEKCIERLQKPERASALFAGWEETVIWSCLQGIMGNIYGDCQKNPLSAAAILGDFCFLAGEPSRSLASYKPKESKQNFMIMVPQNEQWGQMIRECWGGKAKEVTRYALKKEQNNFDKKKLHKMAVNLPDGYEIKPITQDLYEQCKEMEWSRDLVGQYKSFAEYESLGLGFAVIKDSKVAAGASSYSSYKGGIEIQIDTQMEHRRKGLARACGATLILECLKRCIYPSWDAQNPESVALAEQLGYHPDHPYPAYEISDY
ncbi:MAG: GNAT family N-acetyltransferase [Lachnospiraceae bacterium]|jgi:hypothetical protein|uniref:GNAT family N-acetyltransferase n=1 Tax=Candidatus Merdisoma sp. JLR.KK006 TaxID=3112626 RepID=UPI002FF22818|nr:GNAT family N-acetyltransferase [Lachnospiraceae bacterium]